MSQPRLLIFDDGRGDFGPLTDLHPAFDLRTGAFTTRQRLEAALGPAHALVVRHPLAELTAEGADVPVNQPMEGDDWLMVSGRLASAPAIELVQSLERDEALVQADGTMVAVHVSRERQLAELQAMQPPVGGAPLRPLPPLGEHVRQLRENVLLSRPWDILAQLPANLGADLGDGASRWTRIDPGDRRVHVDGKHPVFAAPDAVIQPGSVLLTDAGPIAIDQGALVGALSVLEGPCYVGAGSILAAHTSLRPNAVIGPFCKVAGEISHSILQGYSNKAHLGYLGHSLVGQWVNLGAGTVVSNLKNTYGPVRVQLHPDRPAEDSGVITHGPIIGDHVRTAIGTRLITGACIATGTMLALSGFAPKCTRRLTYYTDEHPEGEAAQIDKFLATCRAMMARRKVELTPAEEARLRALGG